MGVIGDSGDQWPPQAVHRETRSKIPLAAGVEVQVLMLRENRTLKRRVIGVIQALIDDSREVRLDPAFNVDTKKDGTYVIRLIKRGVQLPVDDPLVHIGLLPPEFDIPEEDG